MFRRFNLLRQTPAKRPVVWFLLGGGVFLYLQLFIPVRTTVFLAGADQAVYLLNAMRMREGQLIYRDFFHFLVPGTELVYLTIFRLFGPRIWVPNAVLLLLGVSLTWLSILITKQVMGGRSIFLPGLLFLTFAFRTALDATHHWFSVLAVMSAIALVIKRRSPARLSGAGALCGLASCFTSTRGIAAVIALAVFLVWEYRQRKHHWHSLLKSAGLVFASFLIPFLAFNAYFVWRVGLERFLFCTVAFVLKYYPADLKWNSLQVYMTEMPGFLPWYRLPALGVRLFVHGLVPLVYLLFFSYYRRKARVTPSEPWDRLMLLNILGFFLFIGIAPAPGWVRMCSVSLPALILLVWFLNSSGKVPQAISRLLWVVALILAIGEVVQRQGSWKARLDVPAGCIAILDPVVYDKYQWVLKRTQPSQFFFEAEFADIYFPLGLRDPADVPFVTDNDYTRPEQVHNVVDALDRHRVQFVLWSLGLNVQSGGRAGSDHLGPLRTYLRTHYHVVETFGDFGQIWERNN